MKYMEVSSKLSGTLIDWSRPAKEIAYVLDEINRRRGAAGDEAPELIPFASSIISGERLYIRSARCGGIESPYPPGTIIRADEEVWVQTGSGHLIIEKVQNEARSNLWGPSVFADRGIEVGESFKVDQRWTASPSRATAAA